MFGKIHGYDLRKHCQVRNCIVAIQYREPAREVRLDVQELAAQGRNFEFRSAHLRDDSGDPQPGRNSHQLSWQRQSGKSSAELKWKWLWLGTGLATGGSFYDATSEPTCDGRLSKQWRPSVVGFFGRELQPWFKRYVFSRHSCEDLRVDCQARNE